MIKITYIDWYRKNKNDYLCNLLRVILILIALLTTVSHLAMLAYRTSSAFPAPASPTAMLAYRTSSALPALASYSAMLAD